MGSEWLRYFTDFQVLLIDVGTYPANKRQAGCCRTNEKSSQILYGACFVFKKWEHLSEMVWYFIGVYMINT